MIGDVGMHLRVVHGARVAPGSKASLEEAHRVAHENMPPSPTHNHGRPEWGFKGRTSYGQPSLGEPHMEARRAGEAFKAKRSRRSGPIRGHFM